MTLKKPFILICIFALIILMGLMFGGCGSASAAKVTAKNIQTGGKLEVWITDNPNPAVGKVEVTFTAVKIHGSGGSDEDEKTWIDLDLSKYISNNDDITINLLDYQNGLEKLVAMEENLPAGKYTQIRLEVSRVLVTFDEEEGRAPAEAKLPSHILKFVHPFEIVEGKTTSLLFDWDAEKSLIFTGYGQVNCKPIITLFTK